MSLNTNQKLYFSHVFLFHLFSVFTDLGWIYVLSQGVSIYYILIALMCYRFLQHALTVPVSYMLLKRFPIKTLFVFAIVIQAVYFIVLYSSVNFMLLLIPATLLFSLYDSLYYILRLDIERNIPCEKDIAKNTGYSTALATLAETIGIILLTYGLVFHPDTALAISLIGLFLSCIPILFLQIDHVRPPEKDEKFFSTMLLGKPIRAFLANPFVIVLLTTGLINELIFAIIPALLITFDIQLLHIGLLFGAMKILSFVASVVIGHFEDVDNRILY